MPPDWDVEIVKFVDDRHFWMTVFLAQFQYVTSKLFGIACRPMPFSPVE